MLKTSALIAGIAGAGLGMMIGSVAPASAAEIGVRHTWGNSTQHIRNGLSETTVDSNMSVHETSAGFVLDVKANEFSVEAGERSESRDRYRGNLHATSDVDLHLDGKPFLYTGDADIDGTITTEGTIRGRGRSSSSESEFLNLDGRLTVQGSGYYRTNEGKVFTDVTNRYNFSGSSTSGFSELSTFSR